VPKPVTHPTVKAWLRQLARRLRYDGKRIAMSEPTTTQHAAYAAFGLIAVAESLRLYPLDSAAAREWCDYAAEILEAGAGGPEGNSGDGGDDLPPPRSVFESSEGHA
jgi:hypothetical protein